MTDECHGHIIGYSKGYRLLGHLLKRCNCTIQYYGLLCRQILITITSSFGIAEFNTGFLPYGPSWRRSRRELQANFSPADLESYQPTEQRAVHCLLRNLLSSPDNFEQLLRQ